MTRLVLNYCLEFMGVNENCRTEQFIRMNFNDWRTDVNWMKIFSNTGKFPFACCAHSILAGYFHEKGKLYKHFGMEISSVSTWFSAKIESIFRKVESLPSLGLRQMSKGTSEENMSNESFGWVWHSSFRFATKSEQSESFSGGEIVANILMRYQLLLSK